jgi:ABC-type antimicrobial peptide transport system permease subunit
MRPHRVWLAMLVAGIALVAMASAAAVPLVNDLLSYVIGFGVVVMFLGIRLLAYRWHDEADRDFDFWGGMSETSKQLLERYARPGANPIVAPGRRPPSLPDADPTYLGHPIGRP